MVFMLPIGGSREPKICQYCTPLKMARLESELLGKSSSTPIEKPSLKIVSTTTEDFPPRIPSPSSPDNLSKGNNGEQSLTFKIKPYTKIYYFGAKNLSIGSKIPHYSTVYDYKNSGIATSNSKGEVTIKFDCPTVYVGRDGEVYFRHIHYIEAKNGKWEKTINTKIFVCNITKIQLEKSKKTLLINALPLETKENIKGSLRIPYKSSLEEIKKALKNVEKHQSIIVYCWNKECSAGHQLIEKLIALGFSNLYDYKGGIEEYFHL